MRHLIDPLDFTKEETQKLLDLADRIHDDPEAYQDVADRKRLATLFYEPSTRTRLSFESAMLRLGGKTLGFAGAQLSSASKGETVEDTREVSGPLERVLAGYLGLDRVQLIRCGGSSQIAAEREQWNDGSNTLCIAPGVVVVYDRNYVTNQILEDSGIRVLKMPSAELSRGRGGPRCMSMPLWRDEI